MDDDYLDRLCRAYAEHPLTADNILSRVRRDRGTLEGITEPDLAYDEATLLTDQNHSGGAEAVKAVAGAVGLRAGDRVLDVGTGLGGAPRLLAFLCGCRCHGVELTETRYRDAVRLTRLVGLEDLVSFTHGDFLAVDVPGGPFDLVLGQGSFTHFPDHGRLLARCAALARPGGWLVADECYLRREPAGADEARRLEALCDCWNGRFYPLKSWDRWLRAAGLARRGLDDLTEMSLAELCRMKRLAGEGKLGPVTDSEARGWRLGAELIASGLVAPMRLIARAEERRVAQD